MTPPDPESLGVPAGVAARWDVPLRAIASGPGALAALPAMLDRLAPLREIALVTDRTPKTYRDPAAADPGDPADVDAAVRQLLPAGVPTRTLAPLAGPHGPVLDEATLTAARAAADGASLLLAVGSGTVVDLAKQVGGVLDLPVVVVQTAASVNGYADPLSVLVRSGAKRTVPSTWPAALVVDHDVLRGAPAALTRSGVGDATATWTAPADWYLACALGLDRAFDADTLETVIDAAGGLLTADPDTPAALTALADTLTLGGLAIGVTGTTAVLSGCEHLVSHLLDMAALADGSPHDLHGTQVGVASIAAAALWEIALDELSLGTLDPWSLAPPPDLRERTLACWVELDPTGGLGAECWAAVERKFTAWSAQRAGTTRFLGGWDEHEDTLRRYAYAPEVPARALQRWDAPRRFGGLTPAVDADRARWALRCLPFMRDRFTLADLLLLAGYWTDELVERVLHRAAGAGGGL